jgi:branched-chain amino acid transport system permease protein
VSATKAGIPDRGVRGVAAPGEADPPGRLGGWRAAVLLIGLGIAAILLFYATGPSSRITYVVISIGIFSIAATGLALLYGDTGQMSVAHGAIIGLGAYVVIYGIQHGLSWPLVLLISVVVGVVAALLVGIPSLRLQGHYFVITTFAAAEAMSVIATNTKGFGGPAGLSLPAGSSFLQTESGLYYAVFGTLVLVVIGRALLQRTSFGGGLVGIRENEMLARSLGIPTNRYKTLAFVVSGGVCGLAGFFYAFANQYVSPKDVGSAPGIILVLILILGGSRYWLGPIVGAAIYFLLPYVFPLSAVENQFAIGIVLVLVVLILPHGIVGTVATKVGRQAWRAATPWSRRPSARGGER